MTGMNDKKALLAMLAATILGGMSADSSLRDFDGTIKMSAIGASLAAAMSLVATLQQMDIQ